MQSSVGCSCSVNALAITAAQGLLGKGCSFGHAAKSHSQLKLAQVEHYMPVGV